tara:strand:+ start:2670 stop:4847 length:2178 start_codon:yes stop_codon:yes gene_type:complete
MSGAEKQMQKKAGAVAPASAASGEAKPPKKKLPAGVESQCVSLFRKEGAPSDKAVLSKISEFFSKPLASVSADDVAKAGLMKVKDHVAFFNDDENCAVIPLATQCYTQSNKPVALTCQMDEAGEKIERVQVWMRAPRGTPMAVYTPTTGKKGHAAIADFLQVTKTKMPTNFHPHFTSLVYSMMCGPRPFLVSPSGRSLSIAEIKEKVTSDTEFVIVVVPAASVAVEEVLSKLSIDITGPFATRAANNAHIDGWIKSEPPPPPSHSAGTITWVYVVNNECIYNVMKMFSLAALEAEAAPEPAPAPAPAPEKPEKPIKPVKAKSKAVEDSEDDEDEIPVGLRAALAAPKPAADAQKSKTDDSAAAAVENKKDTEVAVVAKDSSKKKKKKKEPVEEKKKGKKDKKYKRGGQCKFIADSVGVDHNMRDDDAEEEEDDDSEEEDEDEDGSSSGSEQSERKRKKKKEDKKRHKRRQRDSDSEEEELSDDSDDEQDDSDDSDDSDDDDDESTDDSDPTTSDEEDEERPKKKRRLVKTADMEAKPSSSGLTQTTLVTMGKSVDVSSDRAPADPKSRKGDSRQPARDSRILVAAQAQTMLSSVKNSCAVPTSMTKTVSDICEDLASRFESYQGTSFATQDSYKIYQGLISLNSVQHTINSSTISDEQRSADAEASKRISNTAVSSFCEVQTGLVALKRNLTGTMEAVDGLLATMAKVGGQVKKATDSIPMDTED